MVSFKLNTSSTTAGKLKTAKHFKFVTSLSRRECATRINKGKTIKQNRFKCLPGIAHYRYQLAIGQFSITFVGGWFGASLKTRTFSSIMY